MEEISAKYERDLNLSMEAARHVDLGTRLKYLQEQDGYTYAGVIQLVETPTCNREVRDSISLTGS